MGVKYQDRDNGHRVIHIQGRFDFSIHDEFLAAFRDTNGQATRYEVQMGETEYLDSAALGMLMLLREHAGNDASRITLKNPRPEVKEVLEIANFNRLFQIRG